MQDDEFDVIAEKESIVSEPLIGGHNGIQWNNIMLELQYDRKWHNWEWDIDKCQFPFEHFQPSGILGFKNLLKIVAGSSAMGMNIECWHELETCYENMMSRLTGVV